MKSNDFDKISQKSSYFGKKKLTLNRFFSTVKLNRLEAHARKIFVTKPKKWLRLNSSLRLQLESYSVARAGSLYTCGFPDARHVLPDSSLSRPFT